MRTPGEIADVENLPSLCSKLKNVVKAKQSLLSFCRKGQEYGEKAKMAGVLTWLAQWFVESQVARNL